ncbi:unnamed protein product [Ranitomeya imitator]|uniref:Uncharacterized protein n=1 Tax=Ranitomeya imitator TaxID=111125 RepID=A0ABN9MA46_9NEOB|nr:unnamed protein product [Ranitomeya imitator]
MPECTQTSKKKSYSSSNSSSSGGDAAPTRGREMVKEKKVTYDLDEQKYKFIGEIQVGVHFKTPIKSRPFYLFIPVILINSKFYRRSNDSASASIYRKIRKRSLTRTDVTTFFRTMRIRFPGKMDEDETCAKL